MGTRHTRLPEYSSNSNKKGREKKKAISAKHDKDELTRRGKEDDLGTSWERKEG